MTTQEIIVSIKNEYSIAILSTTIIIVRYLQDSVNSISDVGSVDEPGLNVSMTMELNKTRNHYYTTDTSEQ